MYTCNFCSSELKEVIIQTRAADEGSSTISFCPLCPISNSEYMNLISNKEISYVYKSLNIGESYDRIKDNVLISTTSTTIDDDIIITSRKENEIRVVGDIVDNAFNLILSDPRSTIYIMSNLVVPVLVHIKSGYVVRGICRHRKYYDGRENSEIIETKLYNESIKIYPNCSYNTAVEIDGAYGKIKDDYSLSVCMCVELVDDEFIIRVTRGLNFISLEVEFEDIEKRSHALLKALKYCNISKISINNILGNTCSSATISHHLIRSYDSNAYNIPGTKYTPKPDGERVIAIKSGWLWTLFRPNVGYKVHSVIISHNPTVFNSKGYILDLEYMNDGKLIGTSVVRNNTGDFNSVSRDLLTIITELNAITSDLIDLIIKPVYNTYRDAINNLPYLGYKCDGVIGHRQGSSNQLKFKDIRSLEVRYENYRIYSSDNVDFTTTFNICFNKYNFKDNCILEIRFKRDSNSNIAIHDVFERHDKLVANPGSIIEEILNISLGTNGDIKYDLKVVTDICFNVRKHLYSRAYEVSSPKKGIILDVGTGRGQSFSTMFPIDSRWYLMVDPCTESYKRAILTSYKFKPIGSDLSLISKIFGGSYPKHTYYNGTLNSLITDSCFKLLLNKIGCVVLSFSISYCLDDIKFLVDLGIKCIGTVYLYDNANSSNNWSLIDTKEVSMKLDKSSNMGYVTWEQDTWIERPLVRSDLESHFILKNVLREFKDYDIQTYSESILRNLWTFESK